MERKFRYYTDSDGLSSNTVQCIYQDEKGYIWVGTADGLDRFNSCDFISYRSDYRRHHTLENNCIYSLCGDAQDASRIWVGTSDGVYVFDTRNETFVGLPIVVDGEEQRNLLIYSLAADVLGNMWIGTYGNGLFRYNIRRQTFEHYTAERYPDAFASNIVSKILIDSENNVWVAAGGGSLLGRYNPENNGFTGFRVEDALTHRPIPNISSMIEDSFGDLWVVGYACELYKFERARQRFTCNRPRNGTRYGRVRSMIESAPGAILLGTDHGLVSFDTKNRRFEEVDNGTSGRNGRLNDQFVHAMIKDSDGGIWIGTYFGGLNYLSPFSSFFTTISAGEGCGRIISRFCEDPDGNIWIGSDDGGLSLYDPQTERYERVVIDPLVPSPNIHALEVDGDRLWVGTYGSGLYCVELRTRRTRHFTRNDTGLDNLDVYSLYRDSRGRLWIGTKRGICRYDEAEDRIACVLELGHNSDVVDICEDHRGSLWFASTGNGLIRYVPAEDRFTRFSQDPKYGLPDFVSSLAVDGDRLWIGTQGKGLCRYEIGRDTLVMEFDRTIYGNCAVFQIIQNGNELWLTTNRGLLRYDGSAAAGPIRKYTSEDGLMANIFNVKSGIKSSTGHIYIGCNNGITKFYPYDLARQEGSVRLNVVFPDFRLSNRSVPIDSTVLTRTIDCQRQVRLQGRKISFSLDFVALNFSSPQRTVYRYRLENFDDKWITTGLDGGSGVQHVSYTNLPPDDYRFVVSASNNGEQFGEEAVVEIRVLPPWWMADGMIAGYVCLFLAAAGIGLCCLIRSVRRVRRERIAAAAIRDERDLLGNRVDSFADAAREIGALAALIYAPAEEVAREKGLPEGVRADVGTIRRNCGKMLDAVERILKLRTAGNSGFSPPLPPASVTDVSAVGPAAGRAGEDPVAVGKTAADADGDRSSGREDAPGAGVRPEVLFVGDNDEFAAFFAGHLAGRYAIRRAGGAAQAFGALQAERFSAVVCAVAPEEEAIRLCGLIRADLRLAGLPVVLISTDDAHAADALRAGADVCLRIPVSVDCLDGQLRALIERRNQLRLIFSKMPYRPFGEGGEPSSENRFMAQVNRYVTDHLSDSNISVDQIAEAVHVSRSQFFSRIKSLTGITPNEYLRTTRLKAAAELLAAPNGLRVTEICYKVGFTSTSYFAKCFQAQFGMLPNEYLERYRRD